MATIDEIREKIAEAVAKNDEAKAIAEGTGQAVETAASAAAKAQDYRDEMFAMTLPKVVSIQSGSTVEMKHGVIYFAEQSGALDLTGLTVAENATVYIQITSDGSAISFPASWVWGIDAFDSTLDPPTSPTALFDGTTWVSGTTYLVSVHSDENGVIATVSYARK